MILFGASRGTRVWLFLIACLHSEASGQETFVEFLKIPSEFIGFPCYEGDVRV